MLKSVKMNQKKIKTEIVATILVYDKKNNLVKRYDNERWNKRKFDISKQPI